MDLETLRSKKREWWRENRGKAYSRRSAFIAAKPQIEETLTPVEGFVIKEYFGVNAALEIVKDMRTLTSIADELGVTKQRVSYIKKQALIKLTLSHLE